MRWEKGGKEWQQGQATGSDRAALITVDYFCMWNGPGFTTQYATNANQIKFNVQQAATAPNRIS